MFTRRLAAGFAVLTLTGLAAAPALADRKGADACAGKLSGDGRMIYDQSVDRIAAGADVEDVVTEVTKSLAYGGKIGRLSARSNAEAAGACLVKIGP
nr:hypothetical protein [Ancylobacter crimeensis]